MIPPSDSFDVPDVTVCGVTYSIGATFATQADFLAMLNSTLVPAFGLLGTFSIVGDELYYTTTETCIGDNCVTVEDPNARITADGIVRETTAGDVRITV